MNDISSINSNVYSLFCSTIPKKLIATHDDADKCWHAYDTGPKQVTSPIIFLTSVSGTADVYYKQLLHLHTLGYRCISLDYPILWTIREFLNEFLKLLDHLKLTKIHLFGSSLGGFLAQKFAENNSHRVASLILCNTFIDTSIFQQNDSSKTFWLLPLLILKKTILRNINDHDSTKDSLDKNVQESIEFMISRLDKLTQKELASRLTLNCVSCYVQPQRINQHEDIRITLIDVYQESALSTRVKDEIAKCYPNAKLACLKSGGNFPYLSRADEIIMSNSIEEKKLVLLETLVKDQKLLIQQIKQLNNNVEDLMSNVKELKVTSSASSSSPCSSRTSNSSDSSPKPPDSIQNECSNVSSKKSLVSSSSVRFIDTIVNTSHSSNESDNSMRSTCSNINTPNNSSSTPVIKNGLREFSTFVSKMVKQKFGSSYLAMTRINELDRYVMQRIKEEAIAKYLPQGVSPQFAWNHAMNSLRQLRHRQCKKARANSDSIQQLD